MGNKIEIKINKSNFSGGEVIDGVLTLQLGKPIKARELRIEMFCERKSSAASIGSRRRTGSNTQRLFEFKQHLDDDKQYPASDQPLVYPFKIKLPNDINFDPKLSGIAGTALDIMKAMGGVGKPVWYLNAVLDIPMGLDVSKKIQINVT